MFRVTSIVAACSALVLALGCSARRPPDAHMSTADLAIRSASDETASEHAPLDLRLAREKLDQAREAVKDDEYDRARRLAEESLADAQVAEAKSRAAKARDNLKQAHDDVEALRKETERSAVTR